MIGVWTLTSAEERSSLAYLIANAPADGRYEVRIMTTDNLFEPTVEDWQLLKAENAELKQCLAEATRRLEELLQRLAEGEMPL